MKTTPILNAARRRLVLHPAGYASLAPKTAEKMRDDLKAKHAEYEGDSCRDTYAYCDTAFENFSGSFSEFQSRRAQRSMDSYAAFLKALRQAERHPDVVALIRAEGGDLADWLSASPVPTTTADRRRVARLTRVPA
jgi:hypothetical protein